MIPGKGFGFIEFKSAGKFLEIFNLYIECALAAMQQLDGISVRGDRISVKFAKVRERSSFSINLFQIEITRHLWISNLSPTITQDTIKKEFLRYGKIEQIHYKKFFLSLKNI